MTRQLAVSILLAALACSLPAALAAQSDDQTTTDEEKPSETPASDGESETGDRQDATSNDDGLESDFSFGSYGRVQIDFDEKGNLGTQTNVVGHGPRMLEESYAEVDLSYKLEADDGFGSRVLFTLALDEPFAHFDGDFVDQSLAVRNLYAEAWGFIPGLEDLKLWVGSRMYRGDDIYLLDYWPLDELNTVGGGVVWRIGNFDLRTHVGVNRLGDDFQFQRIEVPADSFGTRDKLLLERQRTIASTRAAYHVDLAGDLGAKAVAYGEYHGLPSGQRIPPNQIEDGAPRYPEDEVRERLPSDSGGVLGAQLGLYGFGPSSHLNLFFRWATGLAAYGEFGIPFGESEAGTSAGAREIVGAFSTNWESKWFGLMAGGHLRKFQDADDETRDLDDFVEGAVALRPLVFVTDHFHQGFEVSYQSHYPFGLESDTGRHNVPKVFQASVMEIVGLGRGSYKRPQIRLHYTLSLSNDDARKLYPKGDVRRPENVEHYIGLAAEWWFNSSRY